MDEKTALYIALGCSAAGLLLAALIGWLVVTMAPYFVSHKRTPHSWKVRKGRYAATGHKGMTVFLIGMRVNRWWRPDLWIPPLLAMARMLRELQDNDVQHGYYGGETYGMITLLFGYPSLQVLYWESIDHLLAFSCGGTHKSSMRAYMKAMDRCKHAVGVWHESYEVSRAEGVHRDMPEFGMVRATGSLPALGERGKAAGRLNECPASVGELQAALSSSGGGGSETTETVLA